jgi:hypothetical protein
MSTVQTIKLIALSLLFVACLASPIAAQNSAQNEQARNLRDMTTLSCAGYIRYERIQSTAEIVGAEGEPQQHTFAEGDVVFLNAGAEQGIKEGQQFSILRPRGDVKGVYRQKKGFLGRYVQELGRVQVFKLTPNSALAQITFSCDTILLGDLIAPVRYRDPVPASNSITLDKFAQPSGKQLGRLMMAKDAREMVTKNDVVYIDLGSEDGVKPGDFLTIYRPLGAGGITTVDNEEGARNRATGFQSEAYRGGGFGSQAQRAKDSTAFVDVPGRYSYRPITTREIKRHRMLMPRQVVGEMVIIDIQTRTATALITNAIAEVHTGDWVEIK